MSWGRFSADGVEYDLTHLDPFTMTVTPKAEGAPSFRVLVSFGCHTFTRKLEINDPDHMRFIDGSDTRCFCPVRHGQSSHLPAMIRAATTGRAYFSHNRNFLLLEQLPGGNAPYVVAFNLEQARARPLDAVMFVVSAYENPNIPRLPKITFATLVSNVSRGVPVVRPKK